MYLENPKQEEGAEDDPAIMTSHIIRAPPVLCAQVGVVSALKRVSRPHAQAQQSSRRTVARLSYLPVRWASY